MFINQIRAAVEAAETYAQISNLERLIWQHAWPAGYLADVEADELTQVLHAKKKALEAAAASRLVGFVKPKGGRRGGPKNAASIARRRRLAACWPLPPELAAQFTISEQAALRVVADQLRRWGSCTLFLEQIAAIAGTCKTVVKNALRKAKALRLLTVEERRRRGQPSLTNIVRFLCMKWRAWILRKGGGVRNTTTTDKAFRKNGTNSAVESFAKSFSMMKIASSGPRAGP